MAKNYKEVPHDKNNCFLSVGDIIKLSCADGTFYTGKIFDMDIKKEDNSFHPAIYIEQINDDNSEDYGQTLIWVEQIVEMDILKFA